MGEWNMENDARSDVVYTADMRLWDYDPATLGTDAVALQWKLERQILYGTDRGEKLDAELLKKFLPKLNIPPDYRRFLELVLS